MAKTEERHGNAVNQYILWTSTQVWGFGSILCSNFNE